MLKSANEKPNSFIYWLADCVVRLCFKILYRVHVEGVDCIPREGPLIVACNHISNLDPPLVGICIPRYIRFMAKAELFVVPMVGNLLKRLGAFPIRRGRVDKGAIRMARRVVAGGGCLVMFPEGRRSKTGELGPFLAGVGAIAKKENAPVIPVAIRGPYRLFGIVHVTFGQPVYSSELSGKSMNDVLRSSILEYLGS